jgi:hypothetical protein
VCKLIYRCPVSGSDWRQGVDSGFPKCCVAWFLFLGCLGGPATADDAQDSWFHRWGDITHRARVDHGFHVCPAHFMAARLRRCVPIVVPRSAPLPDLPEDGPRLSEVAQRGG